MIFKNRLIAVITISPVSFNLIFGFFIIKNKMSIEKKCTAFNRDS